jgi:hypothetical protein
MLARGMTKGLLIIAALLLVACSDDGPERPNDGSINGDTAGGDGGPPPNKKLSFVLTTLDPNKAGLQIAAATNGTKIGVAYLRPRDLVKVICQPTFPGAKPSGNNRPAYEVYYVEFSGGAWGTPVKVDQTIGAYYGVSIAMDSAGKTYIGYLGGKADAELSLVECASSNATVATSTNGTTWTTSNIDTAGGTGDTVGYWMSLALDSKGTLHSAHKDVHFGYYEQDGKVKASLRYNGAKLNIGELNGDNGSGDYASLIVDAQDKPIIAYYNGTKMNSTGGLQIAHNLAGSWSTTQLAGTTVGERLSLAHHKGTYGLAFHNTSKNIVSYIETKDAKTWGTADTVDTSLTNHGSTPSLAFDSAGNPAISYHRCSDYGAKNCQATKDALMLAYRIKGVWNTFEVDTGDSQICGKNTSIIFNSSDQLVIAYRCVTFDNLANDWVDTLKAAKGVWK